MLQGALQTKKIDAKYKLTLQRKKWRTLGIGNVGKLKAKKNDNFVLWDL